MMNNSGSCDILSKLCVTELFLHSHSDMSTIISWFLIRKAGRQTQTFAFLMLVGCRASFLACTNNATPSKMHSLTSTDQVQGAHGWGGVAGEEEGGPLSLRGWSKGGGEESG